MTDTQIKEIQSGLEFYLRWIKARLESSMTVKTLQWDSEDGTWGSFLLSVETPQDGVWNLTIRLNANIIPNVKNIPLDDFLRKLEKGHDIQPVVNLTATVSTVGNIRSEYALFATSLMKRAVEGYKDILKSMADQF